MGRLPLIIGHRGASALAPENTLAAFHRALADRADGIEFDIRLARDGVAVVIHDATLERTALKRGKVSQLTAAELKETNVGTWFRQQRSRSSLASAPDPANETIPLLEDVFDLFASNDKLLYLEMKADNGDGPELAAEVVRMIRQSPVRDRVVVECFDLSLIQAVKLIDWSIQTAALFEPRLSRPISIVRRNFPRLAHAAGADEIALHYALAKPRTIEQALNLNQRVVVWTVDTPDWITKAQSQEITALITNNPGHLVKARDSKIVS